MSSLALLIRARVLNSITSGQLMTFCPILTLHSIPWTFRVSATSYIARTFCHLMLVAGSDPFLILSWLQSISFRLSHSQILGLPLFSACQSLIFISVFKSKNSSCYDKIVDVVTNISMIVSSSQPFVSLLMNVTYFMLLQVGQNVSSASPLPVSVSYRQHK